MGRSSEVAGAPGGGAWASSRQESHNAAIRLLHAGGDAATPDSPQKTER